jgi:SPP1 gp7 family putative phage head morphogenesis protein
MAGRDIGLRIEPNRAAADYIRGKAAVHPAAFGGLPGEIAARAFTAARVNDLDVLRELREEVARLPEGGSWREIRKSMAAKISPWMDGDEAAARAKAELLLRTHGFEAYAAGRWRQQTATREALPYWKYLTAGDAHVRPEHAALDGLVLPADDPFWDGHYPPWDFGCRCVVAALPAAVVEAGLEEASAGAEAERRLERLAGRAEPSRRSWRPGDLHMDLDGLRERYGDGWGDFAEAMRGTRMAGPDGGRTTVWEWLWEDVRRKDAAGLEGLGRERVVARHWDDASPAGRADGTEGGVDAGPLISAARAAGRELALMHNHPAGEWASSARDIAVALANRDCVRESGACTAYGRSLVRVAPGARLEKGKAEAVLARLEADRKSALITLERLGLLAYDDGMG